ncbi:MAG: Holliday junction resolvase RecU [Ureaplasma sp.]|nr:Holliday junction resolvase RecU [Ureaplasma sp.]
MKLNSNKGMYLEEIINNSIKFYKRNNIAIIHKLPIPVKIFENKENIIKGKLYLKSNVDYYGIYKGQFVCIEAKQTNENYFYLRHIAEHQWNYMKSICEHQGLSYLIIHFNLTNSFYRIPFENILNSPNLKKIDEKWCNEFGKQLPIYFPGRIELL